MPVASDLYYYMYQSGEVESLPIVLIHGAGGNHLYWPPEVRRMSGIRLFAPDLPGHGKSGGRGQQSIGAYTQYVFNWMSSLGISQAVLVGHSMGGAIALQMALDHPEAVLGLGLVDTGARLPVHPDLLASAASPTTFHSAVALLVRGFFSAAAEPRLVELAAMRMQEIRPSVLHGDLLACDAFDVTARLAEIHTPALAICGAEDHLTPARYSQFLADSIPGGRLEIIPQAAHMAALERPQEVTKALAGFLAGIPYQAGGLEKWK